MEFNLNVNLVRIADIGTKERKKEIKTGYVGSLENHKDADFLKL